MLTRGHSSLNLLTTVSGRAKRKGSYLLVLKAVCPGLTAADTKRSLIASLKLSDSMHLSQELIVSALHLLYLKARNKETMSLLKKEGLSSPFILSANSTNNLQRPYQKIIL